MPLQATSGAASYDAFGGNGVAVVPQYIESVFSTYLYTGTEATQVINNGVDLSTKGGLVWLKSRSAATNNNFFDTARGVNKRIFSNLTNAEATLANSVTSFDTTGFTLGSAASGVNTSGDTYASWSFAKARKFFDVVTWTGTGTSQTIIHALGSAPACIMVKRTDANGDWLVYHRGLTSSNAAYGVNLNTTAAETIVNWFNFTAPTSTQFLANGDANLSGGTYVAYLFAHDAGGFGLTGTDNVISCGSYTGNGSATGPVVTLGYEPQWLLYKRADSTGDWILVDNMRGFPVSGNTTYLNPNKAFSDSNFPLVSPLATGFQPRTTDSTTNASDGTYIYIAIRRGPMKVPTSGTEVFSAVATSGTGTNNRVITGLGFSPDLILNCTRGSSALDRYTQDRLRGLTQTIYTNTSGAEQTGQGIYAVGTLNMSGFTLGTSSGVGFNRDSDTYVFECFKRAPSFFDEVCYIGTGSATTFSHNLQAVPELIIVKRRDTTGAWDSYCSALANTEYVVLNTTAAKATGATRWNSTTPTSSVFSVGTSTTTNASAGTYVAYLFATCPSVSKVGSYTGNGTTQTINCGFGAGGARFVLIKRTDSTGDWYVYDTARGMTVLTDPYLLLNSTAAEVATLGSVTTVSTGFSLNSAILAAINVNAGTYIFLAIA
jgi:hypothetical protein